MTIQLCFVCTLQREVFGSLSLKPPANFDPLVQNPRNWRRVSYSQNIEFHDNSVVLWLHRVKREVFLPQCLVSGYSYSLTQSASSESKKLKKSKLFLKHKIPTLICSPLFSKFLQPSLHCTFPSYNSSNIVSANRISLIRRRMIIMLLLLMMDSIKTTSHSTSYKHWCNS